MRQIDYSIILILSVLLFANCTNDEKELPGASIEKGIPITANLAYSIERTSTSRMSNTVVQKEGEEYRGIDIDCLIPFEVSDLVTINDNPQAFIIFGNGEKIVDNRAYYYYSHCSLMTGVNAFLSYGHAKLPSTPYNKAVYGSLEKTFRPSFTPTNIRFELESISPKTVHNTATLLANYLSAIAQTSIGNKKWSETNNSSLRVLYLNFLKVTEGEAGGEILPGSSSNVKAFAQKLKDNLNALTLLGEDNDMREAIIENINKYYNIWDGFPASVGLPDGAAVIRWNGTTFLPQINNTGLADINGIDRFAYPAELYYFGNSRIQTSIINKRREVYDDVDWSVILDKYEFTNGIVTSNTTAVAIKDPLQYAVARVVVKLATTDATLKDANNENITVGATSFPLTGIIIGGQLPVGFDFKPTTTYPVYSESDMKYIYDSKVKTDTDEYFYLSTSESAEINTLVLQSYDNKKVPIALEFINNSDTDFEGIGGKIYRGTKFYLAGEVDPSEFSEDPRTEIRDRVFTQDYTTTLSMKVTGLAKAYNVVPNLLSPRLELGIELVTKWVSTTPEEVIF